MRGFVLVAEDGYGVRHDWNAADEELTHAGGTIQQIEASCCYSVRSSRGALQVSRAALREIVQRLIGKRIESAGEGVVFELLVPERGVVVRKPGE